MIIQYEMREPTSTRKCLKQNVKKGETEGDNIKEGAKPLKRNWTDDIL